jgi:predicted ATPase/DNA-binding SARP family transcriptional activator
VSVAHNERVGGSDGAEGGVQVHVLGPLEVVDGRGNVVPVPGARVAALLVRLALEEGRPVPAGRLIEDLWGADAPAGELNALQSLVSRLRRALGGTGATTATIVQAAGGYRLSLAPEGLDLARFRRLSGEGRTRLRSGDPAGARELLRAALGLWRGPVAVEVDLLVPGLADTIENQRVDTTADRIEAEQQLGQADDGLSELTLLRNRAPQHERLAALEIRALVAAGRVAEALQAYDRTRRELADELGIDPSPVLQDAYRAALAADNGSARPAEDHAVRDLPAAVTSFRGRIAELDQLNELLRTGRLVTILGPGGAGKTRLALECARNLHRVSGGSDTWLVELAGVTAEADVPQAVLTALGLRETAMLDRRTAARPARETLDLVVDRFAGRPTLVILDNCEHVISAAASLADAVLGVCPNVRIVATSREPLAIAGEFLLPLAPLAVPEDGMPMAAVAALPAIELFVDRARAAQPAFRLENGNRGEVEEIVRRLDGLPLAIELAAARLRTLPVREIATRLSDRFRLLTSGSRTADPRHRTLRAVVAWSWDLLDDDERRLAERVSVFPAGLTRDSAAAVCADPALEGGQGLAADAVPDLLDALVEKSLLQLNRTGDRYRVLETIRDYGQERLIERGELAAVRLSAARHFAALVAEADPLLRTAEQIGWLDRLRAEHDNVIAALRTFCDSGGTGDKDAALRLTLDFGWYWFLLGRFADLTGWITTALAVAGPVDPPLERDARVVAALDRVADERWRAEQPDRPDYSDIVEDMKSRSEVTRPLIAVLVPVVLFLAGAQETARARLDAAVAGPDLWLSAAARLNRARFAENIGDLATVRADTEQALTDFRTVGDQWGVATGLPLVGLMRLYDSDLDGALEAFLESQRIGGLFGALDLDDQLFLAFRLADVRLRRGEVDEARAVLENARQSINESVQAESLVIFYALAAMTERVLGDLAASRRLQQASERALARIRGGPLAAGHGVAIVCAAAAMLEFADGNLPAAVDRLIEGYPAGIRAQDYPILAAFGVAVADLAVILGRHRDAAVILGACTRLRGADDPTQLDIARVRCAIVAALGPETAAAADAEGRALDAAAATARLDPALLKEPALSGQALRL